MSKEENEGEKKKRMQRKHGGENSEKEEAGKRKEEWKSNKESLEQGEAGLFCSSTVNPNSLRWRFLLGRNKKTKR